MKRFLILWRLMLKNSLATLLPSRADGKADWKTVARRVLLLLAVLAMIGVILFVEYKIFQALDQIRQPLVLPAMAVLVSVMGCLFMGFFQTLSDLYQGKDAPWLAVLPVTSREVFAARLANLWLWEVLLDAVILIPALVFYAIGTGRWLPTMPMGLLVLLLLPLIPLALVAMIGSLLMRVSSFARHREMVTTVLSLVLAMSYSIGVNYLTNSVQEGNQAAFIISLFTRENSLVTLLMRSMPSARWGLDAIDGSVGSLLLLAGVSLAAAAALVLLAGGSYLEQALSATENAPVRAAKGPVSWKPSSRLRALVSLEWRELLRTPAWMLNGLAGVVIVPVMFTIGIVSGFGRAGIENIASELNSVLEGVDPGYVIVILGAILSFGCMVNTVSGTAYTREGGRYPFALTLPVTGWQRMLAKLIISLEINLLCCGVMCVVLMVLSGFNPVWFLMALLISQLSGIPAAAISLVVDARHPFLKWINETQAMKNSIHAVLSMFIWFALMALTALLVWQLWRFGGTAVLLGTLGLLTVCCAASFFLMRATAPHTCYLPEGSL